MYRSFKAQQNSLYRKSTRHAGDAICDGNLSGAWDILRKRCRTKPQELALRLALLTGALCDPSDFNRPELAVDFLVWLDRREG